MGSQGRNRTPLASAGAPGMWCRHAFALCVLQRRCEHLAIPSGTHARLPLLHRARLPGGQERVGHGGLSGTSKRVFDLVKDFGTSESPKSTRSSTTHWCPGRPGHPAFRHNIASSLLLHTGLPYDWTPRSDAPLGSPSTANGTQPPPTLLCDLLLGRGSSRTLFNGQCLGRLGCLASPHGASVMVAMLFLLKERLALQAEAPMLPLADLVMAINQLLPRPVKATPNRIASIIHERRADEDRTPRLLASGGSRIYDK